MSWGWRVPFLLSAVVVVVGLIIRLKLDETPEFQSEKDHDEVAKAPLGVLFRDHWANVLRVFFAAFIAMVNTTFQVFALNFATSDDFEVGFSNTFMLWLAIVANLFAIAIIPFWARLSDRVGRKPVFLTGIIGSGILVTAFLGAIAAGSHVLTFVLGVLLAGVVYSMSNAVWPATYAEYFPTRVRLSGMAIGTQFGFALAGFTPSIAGWLMAGETDNWYRVALFACAACAISADRGDHRSQEDARDSHPGDRGRARGIWLLVHEPGMSARRRSSEDPAKRDGDASWRGFRVTRTRSSWAWSVPGSTRHSRLPCRNGRARRPASR